MLHPLLMIGKGSFHPLKSQNWEAKLLSRLPEEGLACFEFLVCANPAQMLDLPVLRPALVPSQHVYISAGKLIHLSLPWNVGGMCKDQGTLAVLCSSLTSLIFPLVSSGAVCQGKGAFT